MGENDPKARTGRWRSSIEFLFAYLWSFRGFFLTIIFCLISILISLYGIKICVEKKDAPDGGRGGAVGVALALIILFISRNTGQEVYRLRTEVVAPLLDSLKRLAGESNYRNIDFDLLNRRLAALETWLSPLSTPIYAARSQPPLGKFHAERESAKLKRAIGIAPRRVE